MLKKKSLLVRISTFHFVLILLSLFVFQTCSSDNPVTPIEDISLTEKFDTTINVDMYDAVVEYEEKVSLLIPKGAVSGDTKLTITKLEDTSIPSDSEMEFPNAYEINLGGQHIFDKALEITLKFDPEKLNEGKLKYKIGAAYYDETLNKWALFKSVSVDTISNTVSFSTTHLTKLSWYHLKYAYGYTDYTTSPHFTIYWVDGKVVSDADYKSSLTNHKGSYPHYIQDILYYLEESWAAYKANKLEVPEDTTDKIEVRVLELPKGEDGNTSFFGFVRLNQIIEASNNMSQEDVVKVTCAHEFLHYVQDYYFMQFGAGNYTKWWLEATAVQADRIVWPNNSKFEAINYANGGVENQLERSWDDCNLDPNYYVAGGFLTYLTTYREGAKLSIPEIIIKSGKATDLSYFRTILDNHLNSSLSSNGIGSEYRKYIRWAYEGNGDIKINSVPPLKATNAKYVVPVRLDETISSWNGSGTIPYLAAKVIKIISPTSEGKTSFRIKVKQLNEALQSILYVADRDTKSYKRDLTIEDSVVVDLEEKSQWIDILLMNDNKDESGSFEISVELVQGPKINSITPPSAPVGTVVQVKGSDFGNVQNISEVWFGEVKALASDIVSWLDTQIDLKVPEGAVSSDVYVTVDKVNSNKIEFIVPNGPEITKINMNGTKLEFTAPNNSVDIKGKNFGERGKLYINGIEESYYSWSDTLIYIYKLPEIVPTGLDSMYIVSGNNGRSNSVQFYNGIPLDYISKLDSVGYDILLYGFYGNEGNYIAMSMESDESLTSSKKWTNNVLTINMDKSYYTYTYGGKIECTFSSDGLTIEKLMIDYTFENSYTGTSIAKMDFHYTARNIPVEAFIFELIRFRLKYSEIENATTSISGTVSVRDLNTQEITEQPFTRINTDFDVSHVLFDFPPN